MFTISHPPSELECCHGYLWLKFQFSGFFPGETEKTEDGWRNDCLGVRTNPGGFTQADASSSFKDKDKDTDKDKDKDKEI